MPSRSSLNVSLTPELEQFVQDRVGTGRYQTASEVVREGLRLLEMQERDRDAAHDALKGKLKRAAAQASCGEVVDGEDFIDQLLARLAGKIFKAGRSMKRYQLTTQAQCDLEAITEHISLDSSVERAVGILQKLRDAFQNLCDMPGMGHFREDLLDRQYKFWSVYSYIIVYEWQTNPIRVIAVVHGARRLECVSRRTTGIDVAVGVGVPRNRALKSPSLIPMVNFPECLLDTIPAMTTVAPPSPFLAVGGNVGFPCGEERCWKQERLTVQHDG